MTHQPECDTCGATTELTNTSPDTIHCATCIEDQDWAEDHAADECDTQTPNGTPWECDRDHQAEQDHDHAETMLAISAGR